MTRVIQYLKSKYAEARRQEMHTDYESVAAYPSYEEANERQSELLSHGVSAFVVRESTGFLEVYMGMVPKFHLFVHKDDAAAAREIVQLEAAADHVHIASCPKCGSGDVTEIGVVKNYQSGYLAHFFELCLVVSHRAMAELLRGPKYRCGNCDTVYLTNFRKPVR